METVSSVHNSDRFYLILAWKKGLFPRSEQSERDLSNTLQTLIEWLAETLELLPLKTAVAEDPLDILLRPQSFIFTVPKCPEHQIYDSFTK